MKKAQSLSIYLFVFLLKHLHAVLHNTEEKESIAAMEAELEQFNIAPLSQDTIVETTAAGKINFYIKTKFVY